MLDANTFRAETEQRISDIFSQIDKIGNSSSNPSEKDILSCEQKIASFHRFFEQKKDEIKIYENSPYYKRVEGRFEDLLNLFYTSQAIYEEDVGSDYANVIGIDRREKVSGYPHYYDCFEGILGESKQAVERFYNENIKSLKRSFKYIKKIIQTKFNPELIDLYEDISHLSKTLIITVENRAEIQKDLYSKNFTKTLEYLINADEYIIQTPPKFKDCLDNCRHALEQIIFDIMQNEKIQITQKFGLDILALQKAKPNMMEEGNRKLIQGTYDYLSLKGSHVYNTVNEQIKEGEFGLSQTYSVISQILASYINSKSNP